MSLPPPPPPPSYAAVDRSTLWIVALAFGAALLGFWAGLRWFGGDSRAGDLAPEFTLAELDGNQVSLGDFRGQRVLINFWATWCGPCIAEMPLLDRTARREAPDLVVLGIAEDEPKAVRQWLTETPVSYPILLPDPSGRDLSWEYGNMRRVLPYSVLIDADGKIVRTHAGMFQEADLQRFLR